MFPLLALIRKYAIWVFIVPMIFMTNAVYAYEITAKITKKDGSIHNVIRFGTLNEQISYAAGGDQAGKSSATVDAVKTLFGKDTVSYYPFGELSKLSINDPNPKGISSRWFYLNFKNPEKEKYVILLDAKFYLVDESTKKVRHDLNTLKYIYENEITKQPMETYIDLTNVKKIVFIK